MTTSTPLNQLADVTDNAGRGVSATPPTRAQGESLVKLLRALDASPVIGRVVDAFLELPRPSNAWAEGTFGADELGFYLQWEIPAAGVVIQLRGEAEVDGDVQWVCTLQGERIGESGIDATSACPTAADAMRVAHALLTEHLRSVGGGRIG